MERIWGARFGALTATLAFVVAFAPAAFAQGGQEGLSTPGAIVTAENPGTSNPGTPAMASDLQFSLTAHSEQSTEPNPSCRPQDLTLRCWGSLFLRVPERGGMTVTRLEVHRVAVGDSGCGGAETGGCEHDEMAVPARDLPEEAQVSGVAVLTDPGNTGLLAGTQVQVKITLTDNGKARYAGEADVQVNQFVPGPVKPPIFESGPQAIQQVNIHVLGTGG